MHVHTWWYHLLSILTLYSMPASSFPPCPFATTAAVGDRKGDAQRGLLRRFREQLRSRWHGRSTVCCCPHRQRHRGLGLKVRWRTKSLVESYFKMHVDILAEQRDGVGRMGCLCLKCWHVDVCVSIILRKALCYLYPVFFIQYRSITESDGTFLFYHEPFQRDIFFFFSFFEKKSVMI